MKIGFIGIGNMGGAILYRYAAEKNDTNEIFVMNRSRSRCEEAKKRFPEIRICDSIRELSEKSDMIIIGVKPQGIEEVIHEMAETFSGEKTAISMATGVDMAYLSKHLGKDAKIIRIMPNTPAQVGEAMVAMCRNENVTDGDFAAAEKIFASTGKTCEIDEALIDCVIGVSGSSPAYTYMYIQALAEAAEANGMDWEKARAFAAQSVLGAAKMVLESSESIEQLRINVCSPNGTTIEAVNKLFENGFMEKVKEGFQAAADRSKEMTEEKAAKVKA